MFIHKYRGGIDPKESEVIRQLRRRGFAVVVFSPLDVGGPLNRKPVEDSMMRAGKRACEERTKQCS